MKRQVWDDRLRRCYCGRLAMPKAFAWFQGKIDNLLSVEWDDLKEIEKSLRIHQPPAAGTQ